MDNGKDQVADLNAKLDGQAKQMERLLRENGDLRGQVTLMEAEKRQWQTERFAQQAVISQRISEMNNEKEEQAREIEILRAKLKAMAMSE